MLPPVTMLSQRYCTIPTTSQLAVYCASKVETKHLMPKDAKQPHEEDILNSYIEIGTSQEALCIL